MSKLTKLKPCLRCRRSDARRRRDPYSCNYYVYCFQCGNRSTPAQSMNAAVRRWNTRKEPKT